MEFRETGENWGSSQDVFYDKIKILKKKLCVKLIFLCVMVSNNIEY